MSDFFQNQYIYKEPVVNYYPGRKLTFELVEDILKTGRNNNNTNNVQIVSCLSNLLRWAKNIEIAMKIVQHLVSEIEKFKSTYFWIRHLHIVLYMMKEEERVPEP